MTSKDGAVTQKIGRFHKKGMIYDVKKDFIKYKYAYLMILPVLAYYIVFHYAPMYGAIIAFKDYTPTLGILDSPWAGFKHFERFIGNAYFTRILSNTFLISAYDVVFGFPLPILLALMINEIRNKAFKSTVQTISYLPHFISMVVIAGMIKNFTLTDGLVNDIAVFFGGTRTPFLSKAEWFRVIFVGTNIWQSMGWNSIIYLAAISGIDSELYEAATMDGAGKLRKIWNITLPCITPTIIILLILRMGQMFNVNFEKIILLYSPPTYSTADVISSFVYRKGLQEYNWSYSAAVGLFNSILNFSFLLGTNYISRRTREFSLW